MAALTFWSIMLAFCATKALQKWKSPFDFVVDVHLFGTMTTKAVWPIMKEQGYGRIMVTFHHQAFIATSASQIMAKLGVVGFINTLKLEARKTTSTSTRWPPLPGRA